MDRCVFFGAAGQTEATATPRPQQTNVACPWSQSSSRCSTPARPSLGFHDFVATSHVFSWLASRDCVGVLRKASRFTTAPQYLNGCASGHGRAKSSASVPESSALRCFFFGTSLPMNIVGIKLHIWHSFTGPLFSGCHLGDVMVGAKPFPCC